MTGVNGEIIRISNKQNITRVKHYILKPVLELQKVSLQHKNNNAVLPYGWVAPSLPLHLSRREEVLNFCGVTNRKLRWAFLNNKLLLNSNLNISYLITRIF